MFKRIVVIVTLLALPLFIGCSKAPETEMQNAQSAMQAAKTAEAEQYAPDAYQMAMDTLNAANAAKQEQDGKFSLFRSYGKSKELFLSAQALSDRAATAAAAEKARVKAEVETLMADTQTLLDNAAKALASAPKGKGSKADIELLKNDLAAANTAFEQAKADMAAEKYLAAKAKFDTVKTKAQGVIDDVAKAKAKKAGK